MKYLRGHVIITTIILATYFLFALWFDQSSRREHENDFNRQQALQVRLSAQSIEDHFSWIEATYTNLAQYTLPNYLAGNYTLDELKNLIAHQITNHDELVIAFFTTPNTPELLYTQSPPPTVIDQLKAWNMIYWHQLSSAPPTTPIVTRFVCWPSYQHYGLLIPVFSKEKTDTFVGVLGLTLDFRPILEQYVIPVRSGEYGAAWIQDEQGLIIYDHETNIIGKNVLDTSASFPDLRRVIKSMFVTDQGLDEYHFTVERGGDVKRKLVAWSTARLGSQRLTIALSAPDSEINANLLLFREQLIVLGALLVFAAAISNSYLHLTQRRTLSHQVDERTKELQTLTAELEQRIDQRTQQLAHERTQLTVILEALDDGVIFRQNGKVIFANPALARLIGFSLEEIIADPKAVFDHVTSLIDPLKFTSMSQSYRRAHERNTVWRTETQLKHQAGHAIDVNITMTQLHNQSGEIAGTVEIVSDITREKLLNQHRDRFITNAAHELRMPLSNLKTRLYLVQRQPDRMHEHLEVVQRATDNLTGLVQDLVDMADFGQGKIQLNRRSIVLQHVIQSTLSIQRPHAFRVRVELNCEQPAEPVNIFADYQRLTQTFNNLLANAINTSAPDGRVTISVSAETTPVHQWAIVQVHDNGPAIPQDQLPLIFEPFYRPSEGHYKHTGMDLALAKKIIDQHGGTITATSLPERGNTFTIQLPIETESE